MEKIHRAQTLREEHANTLSHGAGAALALVGGLYLVGCSAHARNLGAVLAVGAYACSLVILYTISTLYHAAADPYRKQRLRVWDHCSIFILILGTYIPMSLLVIGGRLGRFLCVTNTILSVVGIALNIIDLNRFDRVCQILYALMGWLVLIGLRGIVAALAPLPLALLAVGGIAYTVGIVFYRSQKPYRHFIWHLFVLAGSVLQFFCVAMCCV